MLNPAYTNSIATLPTIVDVVASCARQLLVKWLDVATSTWSNELTESLPALCDFEGKKLVQIEKTSAKTSPTSHPPSPL